MKTAFALAVLAGLHSLVGATLDSSNDHVVARALSDSDDVPSVEGLIQLKARDDSDDEDTHTKCAPLTLSNIGPRSLEEDWEDVSNFTLVRRTMTLPRDDSKAAIDKFIQSELKKDITKRIIWNKAVDVGDGEIQYEDMGTSLFEPLGDKAFSMGTNHLSGCTVLVVISRRAIYMSHYWESISFVPDAAWKKHYKTERKCFTETVLKGLTEGVHEEGAKYPEQVALTRYAQYFNDDTTKAYIMHPEKDAWGETGDRWKKKYLPKWEEIKTTVGDIVPRLKDNEKWEEVIYNRLDRDDPQLNTAARGTVLYKFDPDHRYFGGEDGKTRMTQKKSALWMEDRPKLIHDDTWDSKPYVRGG